MGQRFGPVVLYLITNLSALEKHTPAPIGSFPGLGGSIFRFFVQGM